MAQDSTSRLKSLLKRLIISKSIECNSGIVHNTIICCNYNVFLKNFQILFVICFIGGHAAVVPVLRKDAFLGAPQALGMDTSAYNEQR